LNNLISHKLLTKGNTALVTGATSGIGESYARYFASIGMNLVLVARNIEYLKELQVQLQQLVDVKIISFDLSDSNADFSCFSELNIDLLVNNAGTGYPGEFGSVDVSEDIRLIQLNCTTPLILTHLFLPRMKMKRQGGIIFVSSLMGMQGVPFMAQYSATKGYLLNLGESLYHECKSFNVNIQVLLPGATLTQGAKLYDIDYDKLPLKWMTPDKVVQTSLKYLGERALVIPGTINKFTSFLTTFSCTRNQFQMIMTKFARKVIKDSIN
jgi:short-subunit dehydrogenase